MSSACSLAPVCTWRRIASNSGRNKVLAPAQPLRGHRSPTAGTRCCQRLCHALVHRVAHQLAGEHVLDAGQVKPSLAGGHIDDVSHPGFVRPGRCKGLIEQVVGHRQGMIRVRGGLELALLCSARRVRDAGGRCGHAPPESPAPSIPAACAAGRRFADSARAPPLWPLSCVRRPVPAATVCHSPRPVGEVCQTRVSEKVRVPQSTRGLSCSTSFKPSSSTTVTAFRAVNTAFAGPTNIISCWLHPDRPGASVPSSPSWTSAANRRNESWMRAFHCQCQQTALRETV